MKYLVRKTWKFLIGWMFRSQCNCSKERFGNAIIGLGEQEIREMIEEDGKAEAHCHFCLETYVYPKEELEGFIDEIRSES